MDNRFAVLDILKGRNASYTPIWFMRQAGRVLKNYRTLKERYDFLTLCHTPELATEITLMPVKELDVDAAIMFSDILIPLEATGMNVAFSKNMTPVVNHKEDFEFHGFVKPLDFVAQAIGNVKGELKDRPLLGFSGAPFTLACYFYGSKSKDQYALIRKLIYGNAAEKTLDSFEKMVIDYLLIQIRAGVDAVQLFDSWVGVLSEAVYKKFIFPSIKRIAEKITRFVPLIYYAGGSGHLSNILKELPVSCISCDWRTDIVRLASNFRGSVQGNLDPAVMSADFSEVCKNQRLLMDKLSGKPYIINFGHGVLPDTNQDKLKMFVDWVHNQQQKFGQQ